VPVGQCGEGVVVLHQEATTVLWCTGWHWAAGQVQVRGDHHVDARGVGEQPELRTQAWVEVQQLVPAIPGVEAVVEVDDAPEPQPG
jgi:hypothetical protein